MDFNFEKGKIYALNSDGKVVAEVTYPTVEPDTVCVDHTFVDNELRGQGVAGKLMLALVDDLRKNNQKAILSCSYAKEWFNKNIEFHDVVK